MTEQKSAEILGIESLYVRPFLFGYKPHSYCLTCFIIWIYCTMHNYFEIFIFF